jgi:anaerobic selenocysteine-containing dehydrogenase
MRGLAEAVRGGKLKGLISLGVDLVGEGVLSEEDLAKLSLVAAASPFASGTTAAAGYVLPSALWAEKSGIMAGRNCAAAVAAPGGARSYGWILTGLARELGVELGGGASGGAAKPMDLGEAVRRALEEEGPTAPWTAREPSSALVRSALSGVYVA